MSTEFLTGKVALVTGSSGGLGKAIAERYAALGANVVVHYFHSKEGADEVVGTITGLGRRAVAVQADVTQVADIRHLFEEAVAAFGKLDIVVANAGIELVGVPVAAVSEEQYDKLFSTNAKGAYFVLQEAARRVSDQGRIINVASSTTVFPAAGLATYGASKTPAKYVVEVLAKEVASRGVTVNSIVPYAVDQTGIFANPDEPSRQSLIDANPFKRLATPTDVANLAEFFASDLSSFVSGQHLLVNGGASL